ncbi:MAG TPA: ATP-binding protein [Candidatus Saccharimonadales bacterium]|nr:ATP-binding protein [Candidatus Saccharimonadales bacterium]
MFQTSTPVMGDGFQNRITDLDDLARSIQRLESGEPQWMAILGPRKIGKTSLVLEAARRVKTLSLRVVALDVQEQGPVSLEFFRRFALRIVDAAFGSELGESLERFARQPAAYRKILQKVGSFDSLPKALRLELIEIVEGDVSPDRIAGWLDLPEELAVALDLRFVIALDEFQELNELQKHGFNSFMLLRAKWQKHRRVAYFISGSARSMLLTLVNSQKSPFFQHFHIHDLLPFAHSDAVDLLRRLSPLEHSIPVEVAELAVKTLSGHPFYLQLLGEQLTQVPGSPDIPALKDALQKLLFSRTGRLSLFFENEFQRLVGRSTLLAATLDSLAEGPITLTAVSNAIHAKSGATVNYLERLQDAVVKSEGGFYSLADSVFALWLRWRRPGGTIVPMSVVGDEAEIAVARALSDMGFDLIYQSKASRGAFDLLGTRGSTQLGIQVKRSPLPLRFPRHEWKRMEAEGARFKWLWVVAAVTLEGIITILDPAKARVKKEAVLRQEAEIANLPQWLDSRRQVFE